MNYIEYNRDPFAQTTSDAPVEAPRNQLRSFLDFLVSRRAIILGAAVIVLALGAVMYFRQVPLYTAEAVVIIDRKGNNLVNLDSTTNQSVSREPASVEDQIEIVTSRELARSVIDKQNLWNDPDFQPATSAGSSAWYDVFSWFGASGSDAEAAPETLTPEAQAQLREFIITSFISGIGASPRGFSNAITISYTDTDPVRATRLANAVAETFAIDQLTAKYDATKRATSWLTEQVGVLATQLENAEDAVERYKAQTGLSGEDGASSIDKQIADLNAQLTTARAKRAEAQARFDQTSRGGGSVPAVINSPLISSLRSQEAELSVKLAELLNKYQDRHPKVMQARSELSDIRSKISEETSRIVGSMRAELAAAVATENAIQARLDELESTANDKRQGVVGLRALQREADSIRNLYEAMLARLKSTQGTDEIQSPDARILSEAQIPVRPSSPRSATLVFGALIPVALFFGVAVAFIVDRLDNGFRTLEQVEQNLGLAAIASVPDAGRKGRSSDPASLVVDKPLSAYTEAIRSMQTALAISNVDKPPKVVLVTSALPSEGKTTLAISLARLKSRGEAKVALLDLDLRHPNVMRVSKAEAGAGGVIEYLAGRTSLSEAMAIDPKSSMHILGVNQPAISPPDVLASNAIGQLIEQLRANYDFVVIDSAPALLINDTKLILKHVDSVVFTVRWEKTARDAVAAAIRQLRDAGAVIAGVVLNRTDARRSTIYSYGTSAYSKYTQYYQS